MPKSIAYILCLDSIYTWREVSGGLTLTGKTEVVFDEDNLREISFYYSLDNEGEKLIPTNFGVLYFNNKGLLIKQTYNSWDGDYSNLNDDLPSLQREFTYDKNQNLILFESKSSQAILSNRIDNQVIYTYDNSNNLTKYTWNLWNINVDSLFVFKEYDYSYDKNNNLTEEIRWRQHSTRGWEKTDSIILDYSESGLLRSKSSYIIIAAQTLGLFEKEIFTYSENDQLLSKVDNIGYKVDKDAFSNIYISEYEYDNFNNLALEIRYDSIPEYNDREFLSRKTYTHNYDIFSADVQLPRRNDGMFNYFLLDNSVFHPLVKYENVAGGGGYPSSLVDRVEYFYSDLETSTTDIDLDNELTLTLSPNPSADFISIDIDNNNNIMDVSIIDTQGQLIVKSKVLTNQELDISHLGQGIYFCKVCVGDDFVIERFVKM